MRHQGKLTKWKDDQGFGFITPLGGGEQVFVHIKSFSTRHRRPIGNDIVTYEVASDDKGRIRAERVAITGDSATVPSQAGMISFALPVLFLVFLTASVFVGRLPFVVLALYLAASSVSFLFYARDKSAAKGNHWRTPESRLHVLSLLGGWPGAFVAQQLLRHKSNKESFQIVFWATIVLNCLGLVWLFSPPGAAALQSLLGTAGLGR